MRTQLLGTLLIISALLFAVTGVLFQSIPFVVLCVAFATTLVYSRGKFVSEIRKTDLRVTRVASDELPFAGQPFAMDVKVLNAGPTAVKCDLEDTIPEDCEIAAGTNKYTGVIPGRSFAKMSYTVIPRKRKNYVFPGLTMKLEGEYGLFLHESLIESEYTVNVHTSKESLDRARKLAGREHLEYSGLSRHIAMVMYDLEFDSIREHSPGDRSRDIHWKLFSKLDEMFTKVYVREGVIQTMLFVDCSSSMRVARTGSNKMDHSIDLCMQISKVLLSAFHATGVCLLDEVSVISQAPPSVGRRQFDRIVESLRKAPSSIPAEDYAPRDRQQEMPERIMTEIQPVQGETRGAEGEKFLSIIRSLGRSSPTRSGGIGFDGVVRNLLSRIAGKKLMMIVISDMKSSRDAILSGARFCSRKGSRMLVLHLCDEWYEARDQPIDVQQVESLYESLKNNIDVETKLRRTGALYMRVGPADTTTGLVRAMRMGRT